MNKSERVKVIQNYLQKEGYTPQLDDDGDIVFKCEGGTYCVILEDRDDDFYRICYPSFWSIDSEAERAAVTRAADAASAKTKVAKVFTVRDNTWASIELFLDSPSTFTSVFKRSLSALQTSVRNFREAIAS